MARYVLTLIHGPNWDPARGIREQDGWDAHAEFMDGLVQDGLVILGGPIGDGDRAMVVVDAPDEHEIEERFQADPWKPMGILKVGTIERWTIWLDGTARPARPASPLSD